MMYLVRAFEHLCWATASHDVLVSTLCLTEISLSALVSRVSTKIALHASIVVTCTIVHVVFT